VFDYEVRESVFFTYLVYVLFEHILLPNKYVRTRGRPYIHTCLSTSARRAIFHERRICSVTLTVE